jgi:hypothetical protein
MWKNIIRSKITAECQILDKLDFIECFEQPGRSLRVGEILEKQEQLYYDLGVVPPTSL